MATTTAPPHAALLRDFANTLDVEDGTDSLTTRAELATWLRGHRLLDRRTRADDDDLALARDLREGLRQAFRANHGDSPGPALDDVAARLPLAVHFGADGPHLTPLQSGVRGALSRLLAAATEAAADHSWRRLKICAADDCAWAFYDTSKNQSKTWCSMQVCGNRVKTRSYRARRAVET